MSDALEFDVYDDARRGAVEDTKRELRVALPAAALSYDRNASRVTAQLQVRRVLTNRQPYEEPPVQDIPVLHYSGGGYGFWFDLRAGDPGLVIACDGPGRGYYETGQPVTPSIGQGHDYGCGVMHPGGRVSAVGNPTPPPNAPGTAWMGARDGSSGVAFRSKTIPSPAELGSMTLVTAGPLASLLLGGATAADPVACALEVTANLLSLNTTIQAIPATGGPWDVVLVALKTAFGAWVGGLQPMADAKARVEGP